MSSEQLWPRTIRARDPISPPLSLKRENAGDRFLPLYRVETALTETDRVTFSEQAAFENSNPARGLRAEMLCFFGAVTASVLCQKNIKRRDHRENMPSQGR